MRSKPLIYVRVCVAVDSAVHSVIARTCAYILGHHYCRMSFQQPSISRMTQSAGIGHG